MKKILLICACALLTGNIVFAQKTKPTTGSKSTSTTSNINVPGADAAEQPTGPGGIKIGYLNSGELLASMPEKAKADSDLSKYAKAFQDQIETMMKEYQTKGQEYQEKEKTMSDPVKEVKMKEIQDLQGRIESLQQSAQEKVGNKKQELYQPILEKADKAIKAVAKDKNFDFVFDANGGGMLYGKEAYNITPMVKAKLGIK